MGMTLKMFLPFLWTVAALFSATPQATAAEPKYPPYPDVWGRELPVNERKFKTTRIMTDEGGRTVVLYYDGGQDMVMDFFTGQAREKKEGEFDFWMSLWRENPKEFRRGSTKIVYGPNDRIACVQRHPTGRQGQSWHNFNSALWRGPHFLRPRISKMLFRFLDAPVVKEQDSDTGEFFEPVAVTYQAESYFLCTLYPLDDGTFLAASDELTTVIRFRPDLTSPYIKNRKLFLVDTSMIEKIEEAERHNPHPINQFILDHLTNLRKESFK